MKKIISIFVILSVSFVFTSCTHRYDDTLEVGRRVAATLGDGVHVYYSLANEVDDEYMPFKLRKEMFTNTDSFPINYTVILTERFDTVLEIGVFLSRSRSEAIDISEICLMRVREVDVWRDISADVMIVENLVIYYLTDSGDDLRSKIESAVDF